MIKKLLVSSLTSVVLLSTVSFSSVAYADNYEEAIEENRNTINEAEDRVHNLDQTLSTLNKKVENAEEELGKLENEINLNEVKISETVERLEDAHKEMTKLQEEIAQLNTIISKRTEQLEQQARKIQVNGNPVNYIEFIIDAESLTDVIGRLDVVSNLVSSNRKLVRAQIRDMEAVVEKEERTEQTITQQNALAAELEITSENLDQQRLEKEVLIAQIASERATVQSERDYFLNQRAEAEQAVTQLLTAREEAAQAAQEQRRLQEIEEERAAENAVEDELSIASSGRNEETGSPSSSQVNTTSQNSGNNSASNDGSASESSSQTGGSSQSSSSSSNSESSSNASTEGSSTSQGNSGSSESKPPASTPTAPNPGPSTGTSWASLSPHANRLLGTPYLYGGSTASGIDCSGFTSLVFRQVGINLPRSAAAQYASARKVSNPQPGDLVFFAEGSRVTHVGIYTGGGQFIGSQTSTGVAYASATTGYWGARLVGYGRY